MINSGVRHAEILHNYGQNLQVQKNVLRCGTIVNLSILNKKKLIFKKPAR